MQPCFRLFSGSGQRYTQPVSHMSSCLNRVFVLLCRQEKFLKKLWKLTCVRFMFYISKYPIMSMKFFTLVAFNGDIFKLLLQTCEERRFGSFF